MDCILTVSEKNIQNLFDEWKSNPTMIMGTLHAKCQQIMDIQEQLPTKIMHVTVEFDYNLKTFVFAEEPLLLPISQCSRECQDLLERALSKGNEVQNFRFAFTICIS